MLALPKALARSGIALRADTPADRPFLRALHAAARLDAPFIAQWPAAQREPFLDSQFQLQDLHYRRHHPRADFLIVEQGGFAIGRLVLDRGAKDWTVVDIALMPQNRGGGIGAAILGAVLDGARRAGVPVRLHVETGNRVRRLYERLGFREVESEFNSHAAMVWDPLS